MTEPEETWADLPGYNQRVSSLGVVVGPSGKILSAQIGRQGQPVYNLSGPAGRKTSSIHAIMTLAGFWEPTSVKAPDWSDAELAQLRLASCMADARARLPNRSVFAIKKRKKQHGIKWGRADKSRPRVPQSAATWGRDLWDKVRAACPPGLPHDVRDDLQQDVVVLMLEGFKGTLREAYKQAHRARNRVFGSWYEVSANRYMGGGSSGRSFLDNLAQPDMGHTQDA
jgi:hypothetical protein